MGSLTIHSLTVNVGHVYRKIQCITDDCWIRLSLKGSLTMSLVTPAADFRCQVLNVLY